MSEFSEQFRTAASDLSRAKTYPGFSRLRQDTEFVRDYERAEAVATRWIGRTQLYLQSLEPDASRALFNFIESLVKLADGQIQPQDARAYVTSALNTFKAAEPTLVLSILEHSGVVDFSLSKFPEAAKEALISVHAAGESEKAGLDQQAKEAEQVILVKLSSSMDKIVLSGKEAVAAIVEANRKAIAEFQEAKDNAYKITVQQATEQFKEAKRSLRLRAIACLVASVAFAVLLIYFPMHFATHPPPIITQIVDTLRPGQRLQGTQISVPLLVAASAYFTTLRLSLIGLLAAGLAFSLRLSRAYLHMVEHNHHKLRVTNSFEAFANAVRTPAQRDLVLSKLVEAVTSFGDSGILEGSSESAGPSMFIEPIIKTINKGS